MSADSSAPAVQIQINPPRLFGGAAILWVVAYGLLLALPVFVLTVVVVSQPKYGPVTYLIPLLALAFATVFLPFGFGNPHVSRLVGALGPLGQQKGERFIVQLTLTPRLRSGLRALVEDADDIGWLVITESGLLFEGDSVRMSVPCHQIRDLQSGSSGWRGLFVCGPRTRLAVAGLQKVERLEFAERSSWWVPGSRRTAWKIYQSLAERASKKP
jgi:hypothetical protein